MKDENCIKGGNGNIYFNDEEHTATKKFRNISTKEKISRFYREMDVIEKVSKNKNMSIVEVYEVNKDPDIGKAFIKMKKYDGNLYDLFNVTSGNVKFSFELMIPIIRTLKFLSEMNPPIFHRDLKPDNILFENNNNEVSLRLTDFGICYVDDGNPRLTSEQLAIGPRMFIAPEYELGKVDNVDEKGDIFSVGKILWCMINGDKNSFLPFNIWFIDNYNLVKKFKDKPEMYYANYVISKCLSINPAERPSYRELIDELENFEKIHDYSLVEKEVRYNQVMEKQKYDSKEIAEKNLSLLNIFYESFVDVIQKFINLYPDFDLFPFLLSSVEKNIEAARQFARKTDNINVVLAVKQFENIIVEVRFDRPSNGNKYCSVNLTYGIGREVYCVIRYSENKIMCNYLNKQIEFSSNCLVEFYDKMMNDYLNYFEM